MGEGSAEGSMLRTYLELMVELPWSKTTVEHIELPAARRILDRDHHGLSAVKKRVLRWRLFPKASSPSAGAAPS